MAPFHWGEQVKTILFCPFLSKIEGGRQKYFGMKFLSNTADFGPVFSYWRRRQSKKRPRSHAAFFSHEDGAQKSARLRTEPPFLPQKGLFGGSIFAASVASGEQKETPAARKRPCPWNYRAIWPNSKKKERKRKKEKNTYMGNRTHDLWVVVCCDPWPPYNPHPYHIVDGTRFLNKILVYKPQIAKSMKFSASSRI